MLFVDVHIPSFSLNIYHIICPASFLSYKKYHKYEGCNVNSSIFWGKRNKLRFLRIAPDSKLIISMQQVFTLRYMILLSRRTLRCIFDFHTCSHACRHLYMEGYCHCMSIYQQSNHQCIYNLYIPSQTEELVAHPSNRICI